MKREEALEKGSVEVTEISFTQLGVINQLSNDRDGENYYRAAGVEKPETMKM